MHHNWAKWILSILLLGSTTDPAIAQVVTDILPDQTLGPESSIFTTTPENQITGGASRGANLFHSFQTLSLGTNQTLRFNNAPTIQNILIRVTGAKPSSLDGTIQTSNPADLFLLNPNGIIFGQNAKLEIGGAFSALTTRSIPLGPQALFSVIPSESQLLEIKPSAAFDLTGARSPQGDIQFNANWSANGQDINLVGRNINLSGQLGSTSTRATAVSLRAANNITLDKTQINNPSSTPLYIAANNVAPLRLTLQAGSSSNQGDIVIKDSNIGLYGGRFQATAPGTILLDNSHLLSQSFITKPAEAIFLQGGTVTLRGKSRNENTSITIATDQTIRKATAFKPVTLTLASTNPIQIINTRINQPPKNAQGKDEPGLFPATARPIAISESRSDFYPTQIILDTKQNVTIQSSNIAPRGGLFQVDTNGDFLFDRESTRNDSPRIFSDNFTNQEAEPISIKARNITVSGGDGISTNTIYAGRAPDLILNASENLLIQGNSGVGSNTIDAGNTGNILLTAGNEFRMENGGIGNQSGSGNTGNKRITGNNGQLMITAKNIKLTNFGFNMDNFSQGGNGKITLIALETIDLGTSTGIGSNAKGSGKGADIVVQAGQKIIMRPQSALSTVAEKQSLGGDITLTTNDFLLQGSISTGTIATGNAGSIKINATRIALSEGFYDNGKKTARGTISSYTGSADSKAKVALQTGDSGEIVLNGLGLDSLIVLESGAGVANTIFKNASGNMGKIRVTAGQLEVKSGSQIVSVTNGAGNAGLIDIQTGKAVNLVGSSLNGQSPSGILSTIRTAATVASSQGIRIVTPRLYVSDGAGIISSTLEQSQGNSGNVSIAAENATLIGRNGQKTSSGILTSVGLGRIPSDNIISLTTLRDGVTSATLNPLQISSANNAKGNSGDISLRVGNLDIRQGAQLVTAIVGQGKAGDILIQANDNIRLIDQAVIRADSDSGRGGNINIVSRDGVLFLRQNSKISAVSRQASQDVNISLNLPFVVGVPNDNSDIFTVSEKNLAKITAGSSLGNNIEVTAVGILGFQYRTQFTPNNDIIATGDVTLNLPDIDPSRGLTLLPTEPIEAAQKIDRSCNPDSTVQSSAFITQGPGGLPANPTTRIVPESSMVRLAKPDQNTMNQSPSTPSATLPIEAQSSLRLPNGKIRFISQTPETSPHLRPSACLPTSKTGTAP